ncbi:MAG TPA: nuclear transport factor 2 family protein [Solirubrobacterales bacterium]|nr:nuclear transport factor 2 family protein [Solirubrobacterales bacterium]
MSGDESGAPTGLERLAIERACERLIYEYARRVDFGEAAAIADLFAEDGRWEGTDLVLEGREKIRAWFTRRGELARRVSRHVCTNVAVEPISATEASSLAYMINYRHDRAEGDDSLPVPADTPKWVGELHDTFRLTEEGWRFTARRVTVGFERRRVARD